MKQHLCPHLSVGRRLWSRADGGDGRVDVGGGQGHCGKGGRTRLALLPLVCHEGWQRVELFFTLATEEDVLVVCREDKHGGMRPLQRGNNTQGSSVKMSLCSHFHAHSRRFYTIDQ